MKKILLLLLFLFVLVFNVSGFNLDVVNSVNLDTTCTGTSTHTILKSDVNDRIYSFTITDGGATWINNICIYNSDTLAFITNFSFTTINSISSYSQFASIIPSSTSGVDEWIYLGFFDTGISGAVDGHLYTLSNNGDTITKNADIGFTGFGAAAGTYVTEPDDPPVIITGTYGGATGSFLNIYDTIDNSNFNFLNWTDPSGANYYPVSVLPCLTNDAYNTCNYIFHFGDYIANIINTAPYTNYNKSISSQYSTHDFLSTDGQYIAALGSEVALYEFSGLDTITYLNNYDPSAAIDRFNGVEIINGKVFTYYQRAGSGRSPVNYSVLNITNGNLTLLYNQPIDDYNSSGTGNLIYSFPYFYGTFSQGSSEYLVKFNSPVGANISDFKTTDISFTTNKNVYSTNEYVSTSYIIKNPDFNNFNENTFISYLCDYDEYILLSEDYNDPNDVKGTLNDSTYIVELGSIGSNYFGNALNINSSAGDLLAFNSTNNNVIVSFDLYPENISNGANANFSFLSSSLKELFSFKVLYSNDLLNLTNESGYTLLSVNNTDSIVYPVRIFINFDLSSTQSNYADLVFFGFNDLKSGGAIDEVYTDNSLYSLISNQTISLIDFGNIAKFSIDSSTGFYFDNFLIKNATRFNNFAVISSLTGDDDDACIYTTTGDKEIRYYAADELNGFNYLNYDSNTISVTLTGFTLNDSISTLENSTLSAVLTDIVSIAGFGDDDLNFLSLLILIGIVGGGVGLGAKSGNITGGVVGGMGLAFFMSILFFAIGWLSVGLMVLIVLVCAGMIALSIAKMFSSGE